MKVINLTLLFDIFIVIHIERLARLRLTAHPLLKINDVAYIIRSIILLRSHYRRLHTKDAENVNSYELIILNAFLGNDSSDRMKAIIL